MVMEIQPQVRKKEKNKGVRDNFFIPTTMETYTGDAGGVTLSSNAPTNGNTFIYNINVIGDLLPDQLKKLLLNGEVHSRQDIDAGNNRENVEAERLDNDVQSVGGSSPIVIAENEITSEPEIDGNTADSSRTLIEEKVVCIISSGKEMVTPEPSETKSKEVLKCIVYGGLIELVTSLGIVTSAAGTHTSTGKIVALSLSSLIVGVFVLIYKITELWLNKHQIEPDGAQAEMGQYEEYLGDRQNYRLHFTMAILSFLFFGLVPPLVYGFTFRRPEDKDFKILAVTGVSILCIALLAIMKAHIQKPENCLVYIQSIGNYIIDGIGASVVTTFAGSLIEKYIEQSGWFDSNESPTMLLSDLAFTNLTWRSF